MKKIISLLLCITLLISLTACGNMYNDYSNRLDNAWKVQDYYILNFLNKLLVNIGVSDNLISQLPSHLHSRPYMEKIKEIIKTFGIENYKLFVDSYNTYLKKLQLDMNLPTPNEIIHGEDKNLKGARL